MSSPAEMFGFKLIDDTNTGTGELPAYREARIRTEVQQLVNEARQRQQGNIALAFFTHPPAAASGNVHQANHPYVPRSQQR